jgi:hypothetical protein
MITVLLKKEKLRELFKLEFIYGQNVSSQEISLLIDCGKFDLEKHPELTNNLKNLNCSMTNDVFMGFFFPYAHALCVYYKEEKNIEILKLTPNEQLGYIAKFIGCAPGYLNKTLWRKANTAIDFDAIFSREPHKDEAVRLDLAKWRQFFQIKLLCGFRYALTAFITPGEVSRTRSKKAYVAKFKSFYNDPKNEKAMPRFEEMPVVKVVKAIQKEKKAAEGDEGLNEWLSANMDTL